MVHITPQVILETSKNLYQITFKYIFYYYLFLPANKENLEVNFICKFQRFVARNFILWRTLHHSPHILT